MNYLSHHYTVRRAFPDAAPLFYIGNVLPDLITDSGGRVRARHIAHAPPDDLARGIGLHLATDRRFHSAAEFLQATAEASTLLRAALDAGTDSHSAPAPSPPRRLFFLAHVFVELALDAVLLRDDPALASHFYAQFDAAPPDRVAAAAAALLGRPVPELSSVLTRFAGARYLYDYASDEGLAEGLHRTSRKAGLVGFPEVAERTQIAGAFRAFLPSARRYGPPLWQPPDIPAA